MLKTWACMVSFYNLQIIRFMYINKEGEKREYFGTKSGESGFEKRIVFK